VALMPLEDSSHPHRQKTGNTLGPVLGRSAVRKRRATAQDAGSGGSSFIQQIILFRRNGRTANCIFKPGREGRIGGVLGRNSLPRAQSPLGFSAGSAGGWTATSIPPFRS
jgi:hypothetical protein